MVENREFDRQSKEVFEGLGEDIIIGKVTYEEVIDKVKESFAEHVVTLGEERAQDELVDAFAQMTYNYAVASARLDKAVTLLALVDLDTDVDLSALITKYQ